MQTRDRAPAGLSGNDGVEDKSLGANPFEGAISLRGSWAPDKTRRGREQSALGLK